MLELSEKENEKIISVIRDVLGREEKVIFAYMYGSFIKKEKIINDLDVAIYCKGVDEPFGFQADCKIKISDELRKNGLNISPDEIDLKIINDADYDFVIELLDEGLLLIDKAPDERSSFIEKISLRYRLNEIVLREFYR
ncbi:MAG: hypothetical protein ACK4TF_05235 [Thermodesulfovibrionales bacterium]